MTQSCPEQEYFCPYISKYKDSAKLAKKFIGMNLVYVIKILQ